MRAGEISKIAWRRFGGSRNSTFGRGQAETRLSAAWPACAARATGWARESFGRERAERSFRCRRSRNLAAPVTPVPSSSLSPLLPSLPLVPLRPSSSPLPALPPSTKSSPKICAATDLIGKKERGGTGHPGSVDGIAFCGVILRCGGGGLGAMVVNNGA
jgi:hypothetical protein